MRRLAAVKSDMARDGDELPQVSNYLTGASVLGAAPLFGARAQSPQTISVGVLTDLSGTYRDNTARYLLQVKTPAESTGEWDSYKVLATTPAA